MITLSSSFSQASSIRLLRKIILKSWECSRRGTYTLIITSCASFVQLTFSIEIRAVDDREEGSFDPVASGLCHDAQTFQTFGSDAAEQRVQVPAVRSPLKGRYEYHMYSHAAALRTGPKSHHQTLRAQNSVLLCFTLLLLSVLRT